MLHLDPPKVERADIHIAAGKIVAVGQNIDVPDGVDTVDLKGSWVMPGLVCGHTHLYSALACGMPMLPTPPTDFADMLAKVWWRLDRALDMEAVAVSAQVGGVIALQSGVTTIVDHHASPSCIVGSLETMDVALDALGLRRVLCYEVTDRGGDEEASEGLRAHEGLLARGPTGESAVMVGGHANFTLSDATLERMGAMAAEAGVGTHIHVAEAVDDQIQTGEPLINRMMRTGTLQSGSMLAHCVHLSDDELRQIDGAGAWTSHQPRSNMNNGVGHAPLGSFGQKTVLGTDGIGADMFAELQAGWFRGQEGGVSWSPDRWLACLSSGARFAGQKLDTKIGKLEPGYQADLLVLDAVPGPPMLAENLAASMIFRLHSGLVRHAMVGGHWALRDRQPTGLATDALMGNARRVAKSVWERMR